MWDLEASGCTNRQIQGLVPVLLKNSIKDLTFLKHTVISVTTETTHLVFSWIADSDSCVVWHLHGFGFELFVWVLGFFGFHLYA